MGGQTPEGHSSAAAPSASAGAGLVDLLLLPSVVGIPNHLARIIRYLEPVSQACCCQGGGNRACLGQHVFRAVGVRIDLRWSQIPAILLEDEMGTVLNSDRVLSFIYAQARTPEYPDQFSLPRARFQLAHDGD